MTDTFSGKSIIVTGANSGIGLTAAEAFANAGAKVFGIVRRNEALAQARAKLPKIHWVLADVANADQITRAVESIASEAGGIDVVVNNAATFALASLEQATDALVRGLFEANVFGVSNVAHAALPALKKSRGAIINISSAAGHKAAAGASHYGATKAAVESLTRSWALELAPAFVRVNAIAPGPTDTPVFEKAGVPAEGVAGLKAAFVQQVPLGRIGSSEEVVRWILSLADPKANWVTGQVFSIDGGMSLT